jgi:DNA-binding MarR family transcriptional regulator
MSAKFMRQVERLYAVFVELVRRYQFRDRDQVCCHGLSISQSYTLEALAKHESMTMGELAGHLCLKLSTMTRVVDHLAETGLAARAADSKDRRICRVAITKPGRALVSRVRAELVAEYADVLRAVPAESREAVIDAMSYLLAAFKGRQRCQPAKVDAVRARRRQTAIPVKRR